MRRILVLASAGMVLAGAALAADSPEELVKYRKSVMKALGGHTASIAAVVKGQVSYGPHVAHHARAIKDTAGLVGDVFPPNSTYEQYKKTDALPAIWKEPDKFKAAVEAFEAAAEKFAGVAEGGDAQATAVAFGELGKTCGGCHKPFRYKE